MPRFADVILPLPLEGLFTYAIPTHLEAKVRIGVRVRVPLGKTKTYLAIVRSLREEAPATAGGKAIEYKPIQQVEDEEPMLLPQQLRLWDWMSDYYLAPIGDIYKAALPSGLKAEDGYRPKTEQFVELSPNYRSEQSLHIALDMMKRARKQQEVLMAYLQLVDADEAGVDERSLPLVSREELMNEAHCTAANLNAVVARGILRVFDREVGRLNHGGDPHPERIKQLSEAQADAYNQLLLQMMQKDVTLLHGVTASGKTEIYIHLIQKAIDEGKQVLYLLPEIALTVQITERLQRIFGDRLGIYHSRYSDAERVEIWKKQLSSHPYDVILGARSAVLLPFQQLGLVIIDEEHETSFKQQDPSPRYHARSVAIMLARMYGAKTVLGTATPSMGDLLQRAVGKIRDGHTRPPIQRHPVARD